MEILYLKEVDSTHSYLKNYIRENGYKNPLLVYTQNQTNGIGSRDNNWNGKDGNLFFSFVIEKDLLPKDLPFQSFSIYFSYILKEIFKDIGSKVWIKWPNDFYIEDKKIGGTITNLSSKYVYCGIGINLTPVSDKFSGHLDVEIDVNNLLNLYSKKIEEFQAWKEIFSKYLIEFDLSKNFKATIDNQKISLKDAILNEDGSIQIYGKKVFNAR